MILLLKSGLDKFHHQWLRRLGIILKEMLESGTIRPSQSAWCNTMLLVWKKDGSLHFCIDFCCLNAHMKKDSYPLPRIQEALEEPGGHWPLFLIGSQIQILADKDGRGIKAVHHCYST